MPVVFQNFYTDPARVSAVQRIYAQRGLTGVDATQPHDPDSVTWLINKTRYIDEAFVRQFPNLRGIVVLVNCGRAAVIAEDALYDALRCKRIACYATDVFWREPIPYFDRFRRLDNCIITPHLAESLPDRRQDLLDSALVKITGPDTEESCSIWNKRETICWMKRRVTSSSRHCSLPKK